MENKVKQVTPGVSEIAIRTTCVRHLQVTENCGAVTAPLQGYALGHSLTGVSALLVVATVTSSLRAVEGAEDLPARAVENSCEVSEAGKTSEPEFEQKVPI